MPRVSEESLLPADAVDGDTFSDAVSNSDSMNCAYLRVKMVMLPVARDGFGAPKARA